MGRKPFTFENAEFEHLTKGVKQEMEKVIKTRTPYIFSIIRARHQYNYDFDDVQLEEIFLGLLPYFQSELKMGHTLKIHSIGSSLIDWIMGLIKNRLDEYKEYLPSDKLVGNLVNLAEKLDNKIDIEEFDTNEKVMKKIKELISLRENVLTESQIKYIRSLWVVTLLNFCIVYGTESIQDKIILRRMPETRSELNEFKKANKEIQEQLVFMRYLMHHYLGRIEYDTTYESWKEETEKNFEKEEDKPPIEEWLQNFEKAYHSFVEIAEAPDYKDIKPGFYKRMTSFEKDDYESLYNATRKLKVHNYRISIEVDKKSLIHENKLEKISKEIFDWIWGLKMRNQPINICNRIKKVIYENSNNEDTIKNSTIELLFNLLIAKQNKNLKIEFSEKEPFVTTLLNHFYETKEEWLKSYNPYM